jgi:hypothetical protein
MRILVSWLAVVTLLSATACSLTGGLGAPRGGLRRFYLTKGTFQGNQVVGACGRGYHMASRFEILDVSVLDYDSSLGLAADDSGAGPPSAADGYSSPGPVGWVRTGGASKFRDSGSTPGSASANCATWSSNSGDAYGTAASLGDRFTSESNSPAAVWNGGSQKCDRPLHVWCIQDHVTRDDDAPRGFGRRNRRQPDE